MALHRAAQAAALLEGRRFCLPDDVREILVPALGHRLVLDVDRQLRGTSVEGVLEEIAANVAAPPVVAA